MLSLKRGSVSHTSPVGIMICERSAIHKIAGGFSPGYLAIKFPTVKCDNTIFSFIATDHSNHINIVNLNEYCTY